ncbi:restriction endonuclease subunit S [Providencia huaxiensis]|uniref:restriction endonuclease subunit S n=1 Tax=Providencia TaxID=586 RepID=UPI00234A3D1F|nr:restriction endonuclease subunit S [Providencia sp. PROV076]
MGSKFKLGELLSLLTDYHANGAYKKLKENVELLDEPDFAVMIRTTNFEQEDFTNNLKYINKHAYSFLAKSKVYPNDIIMNKIANAGSSYLMPNLKVPVSLAMNLFLLRVDAAKANPIYVYLYLRINEAYVKSFANGSVTKTITKDAVRNLEIELPSRTIQDRIAEQFICINDKITLNREINQILEQMAQTLFKSWFVDFDPVIDNALDAGFFEQDLAFSDELLRRVELRKTARESDKFKPLSENIRQLFPDAFEEGSEPALGLGGWVPKSWYYSSIYESMDIIFGAPFKSNLFNDLGEGKPIIRIRDLKTGTPQVFSVELHPKKTQIIAGDIIVGMDAEFRATIWSGDDAYLNQRLFLAKPKGTNISNLFVKYSLAPLLAIEEMAQVGTTVAHLGKKDIDKFNIILPNSSVLEAYKKQSDDFLRKIVVGMRENNTLTKLRDTLLPKLISGELSLDDIKIDIPEETLI